MLILSSELFNKPLLSVRTSSKVGLVVAPVINPSNLHIDAFYCQDQQGNELFLQDLSIREFSSKGIIVNDLNDLSTREDLIRLKPVIEARFEILGKQVVSNTEKIGKVVDFATEKESLFIQKLFVEPALWKSLGRSQRVVSRTQIIEINDKQIIVEGGEHKKLFEQNLLATNDS